MWFDKSAQHEILWQDQPADLRATEGFRNDTLMLVT
jgi:hypothetical protein